MKLIAEVWGSNQASGLSGRNHEIYRVGNFAHYNPGQWSKSLPQTQTKQVVQNYGTPSLYKIVSLDRRIEHTEGTYHILYLFV